LGDILKVDFIDDNHFVIYYLTYEKFRTEDEMKLFFKLLNNELKNYSNYEFHGFYDVNIFCLDGIYVLEFENTIDYGRSDFNITMMLNSNLLYEFEDECIFNGEKIYYNDKFYIELSDVIDDIHLFEYGNIIFGEEVDKILNNGILITI